MPLSLVKVLWDAKNKKKKKSKARSFTTPNTFEELPEDDMEVPEESGTDQVSGSASELDAGQSTVAPGTSHMQPKITANAKWFAEFVQAILARVLA